MFDAARRMSRMDRTDRSEFTERMVHDVEYESMHQSTLEHVSFGGIFIIDLFLGYCKNWAMVLGIGNVKMALCKNTGKK